MMVLISISRKNAITASLTTHECAFIQSRIRGSNVSPRRPSISRINNGEPIRSAVRSTKPVAYHSGEPWADEPCVARYVPTVKVIITSRQHLIR
jgi:hypothetical protein